MKQFLVEHFKGRIIINESKTVFSSKANNRHVTGITITNIVAIAATIVSILATIFITRIAAITTYCCCHYYYYTDSANEILLVLWLVLLLL